MLACIFFCFFSLYHIFLTHIKQTYRHDYRFDLLQKLQKKTELTIGLINVDYTLEMFCAERIKKDSKKAELASLLSSSIGFFSVFSLCLKLDNTMIHRCGCTMGLVCIHVRHSCRSHVTDIHVQPGAVKLVL